MDFVHKTVLLTEVTDLFINDKSGIYWDLTCGGGGHSYSLLEKYENIKIIASDWDLAAIKATKEKLEKFGDRAQIIYGNMSNINSMIRRLKLSFVDGFLADFGTSKNQIIKEEGFSFMNDTFLDMRMAKGISKKKAYDILNYASEKELATIFFEYGQETNSRKIAKKIVFEREKNKFKTTFQLASFMKENFFFGKKIHPATKVFQALRIVVNDELGEIKSFLKNCNQYLNEGGRIACISFHSLEDILVKNFSKENKNFFEPFGKLIKPSLEEIRENPSSRSAKLRIFEKKN